jgi:hypothetical protein
MVELLNVFRFLKVWPSLMVISPQNALLVLSRIMIELNVNLVLRATLIHSLARCAENAPDLLTLTRIRLHANFMTLSRHLVVIDLKCSMIDLINYAPRVIVCSFVVIVQLLDQLRWRNISDSKTRKLCSSCPTRNNLIRVDLTTIKLNMVMKIRILSLMFICFRSYTELLFHLLSNFWKIIYYCKIKT